LRPRQIMAGQRLAHSGGPLGDTGGCHCIRDKTYPLLWLDECSVGGAQTRLVFIAGGIEGIKPRKLYMTFAVSKR